ncbi:hypothetical protein R1flu_017711 [Riccia fluitans]|uniref:ditrans,polycis-polyprenyl diphosphate synthase [(2E,6E)-farnesyldiphosphate specific] n=1 Tax=Riccia fluitans TaxID=41844 RepID=A0ABD1ZDR0_9MARC
MPATMHHSVDWLLWRTLHLLFTVSVLIGCAFARAKTILSGAIFKFEASGECQAAVGKELEEKTKGVVVAVVFENLQEPSWEDKVSQLVTWLSALNVRHLTLFDPAGVLKRSQPETLKFLKRAEDNQLDLGAVKSPNFHMQPPPNLSGLRRLKGECMDGEQLRRNEMKLELLSLQDGKESLVRAAKTVCKNAYMMHYAKHHQAKLPILTEQDVNDSLLVNGSEGPDPDLLLLFGKTRSLHGFPPWRLRLTEIVHMGPLRDLSAGSFESALKEFSQKTHRYGR